MYRTSWLSRLLNAVDTVRWYRRRSFTAFAVDPVPVAVEPASSASLFVFGLSGSPSP